MTFLAQKDRANSHIYSIALTYKELTMLSDQHQKLELFIQDKTQTPQFINEAQTYFS